MNDNKLEKDIKDIDLSYKDFVSNKDEQSLFYINQMVDLMYNELKYETDKDDQLNKLLIVDFKNIVNNIFDNLKEYFAKIIDNSVTNINNILSISTSNKYIDANSIKSVYDKFKEEMESNLKVKNRIDIITETNGSSLLNSVWSISPIENKHKISGITSRYISFIKNM